VDALSDLTLKACFCCCVASGGEGWGGEGGGGVGGGGGALFDGHYSGFGYFKRGRIPHGDTLEKMLPLQKRVIGVMWCEGVCVCVCGCVLERDRVCVCVCVCVVTCVPIVVCFVSRNVWCPR